MPLWVCYISQVTLFTICLGRENLFIYRLKLMEQSYKSEEASDRKQQYDWLWMKLNSI